MYILKVIDRKTKEIVQEEKFKSYQKADKLYCVGLKNINPLTHKMIMIEEGKS